MQFQNVPYYTILFATFHSFNIIYYSTRHLKSPFGDTERTFGDTEQTFGVTERTFGVTE